MRQIQEETDWQGHELGLGHLWPVHAKWVSSAFDVLGDMGGECGVPSPRGTHGDLLHLDWNPGSSMN